MNLILIPIINLYLRQSSFIALITHLFSFLDSTVFVLGFDMLREEGVDVCWLDVRDDLEYARDVGVYWITVHTR